MRSTKALVGFFAVHERLPTYATLLSDDNTDADTDLQNMHFEQALLVVCNLDAQSQHSDDQTDQGANEHLWVKMGILRDVQH